jgi:ParB family chromosome partitioning protein
MDQHGWSTHRVAGELGVSQNHVVTALQLLKLPEAVQGRVERGEVPASTAYELSKIPDPAEQARLAEEAAAGRLRRDELRARTSKAKPKRRGEAKGRKATFRVADGKVTVELRKGKGLSAIRTALVSALASLESEAGPSDHAAA